MMPSQKRCTGSRGGNAWKNKTSQVSKDAGSLLSAYPAAGASKGKTGEIAGVRSRTLSNEFGKKAPVIRMLIRGARRSQPVVRWAPSVMEL